MNEECIPSEDRFDCFYFVAPGSDYGAAMWNDLKNVDRTVFLDYVINTDRKLLLLLHHIHFSFAINSIIALPFQNLWHRYYTLEKCRLNRNEQVCVIFTDISACRTDMQYLKYLHSLSNVTTVIILVNVLSRKEKLLIKRLQYFDQVYSFDKNDCEKHGFIYYPTIYSITRSTHPIGACSSNAFFVGISKGNRHEYLKRIYRIIRSHKGTADFYITNVKKNEPRETGINYNRWLSYSDVLDRLMETNCVVEIMGGGQSGLTLRTMEAIVYNKKLLTNNQSVKDLTFYQSGFIRCFNTPEEIDVNFVLSENIVDYQYNGEFSPIHLLKRISKTFSEGASQ